MPAGGSIPFVIGSQTIWDEELERAILYRAQWSARIAYRQSQMFRYAGQVSAWQELWENYRVIWDLTNYIQGYDEEGYFFTPYDVDDNGQISSSGLRLAGTTHAGDWNNVPHGA